jgi:hypothetical protein
MHHHPRWLVDDDQVFIFEHHVQGYVFRDDFAGRRRDDLFANHFVSVVELVRGFGGDVSVDDDDAVLDALHDTTPADA